MMPPVSTVGGGLLQRFRLSWVPSHSEVERDRWVLDRARRLASPMRQQDPETLRAKTREFQQAGPPGDRDRDVMPAIMATVLEAIRRGLGIDLYDSQVIAGLSMARGQMVEMQTGEGKTLAGVFPAYFFALAGQGVHVCLSNDYLARRDFRLLAAIFDLLGLKAALRDVDAPLADVRAAYAADVTYAAGQYFGFDYLRDQWILRQRRTAPLGRETLDRLEGKGIEHQMRHRNLFAAVVDEADQVLIDDATNPLLITANEGMPAGDAEIHLAARRVALSLKTNADFRYCEARSTLTLTESGFRSIYRHETWACDDRLFRPWHEYVVTALKAEFQLQRDRHYVVIDRVLQLVDLSTGRIYRDRSWSDGLHQAVQVKEGLPVTAETESQGKISRQAYFRQYAHLCGMTGTAEVCRREFREVYGCTVKAVAPRIPSRRTWLPLRVFDGQEQKREGLVDEVRKVIGTGRAVLVGTSHIEQTREIASALGEAGIRAQVLSGVQDQTEADVIATAGMPGCVTVATQLAGRGTDIQLHPEVAGAGGLHVIGWEHSRSARVDQQLVGRGARQGDPGSARFYIAPDDQFIIRNAPYLAAAVMRAIRSPSAVDTLQRGIVSAQRRLERADQKRRKSIMQQSTHVARSLSGSRHRNTPMLAKLS